MDLITKKCLEEFLLQNEISNGSESENFQKFVNYCIVAKEFNGDFDIEDISTDKGTPGIDGIGIIVNGKLVDDTQEVEDLIESNRTLDVIFLFVQAKTSNKFEGTEIGNFAFSVKQFFSDSPQIFKGPLIEKFLGLKLFIYDKAAHMNKGNPICKLFYVTTGSWKEEAHLQSIIDQNQTELKSTNLFKDVIFEPCDANSIQKYYRKTREKVSATFSFEKRVTLPDISGVTEAYFGYIPFKEFRKVVADENGVIRGIFYDNIRDFLGTNPVNRKIETTLKEGKYDLFGVLNNGVTLVADTLKATGDKFTVTDYQVVNGCQTSHVLFNCKEREGIENVPVPIRLIVTDVDDIKNQITKATNSQTEIKPEQLESLSEFQKNLEQYYSSNYGDERLYYERRTNQYRSDSGVAKSKIISIRIQIKAFAAMFLDRPHLVSGYYGTIAKNLEENIFRADHKMSPYYTSGLAYYRLETFFRTHQLDSKYKIMRYHILFLLRRLCNKDSVPQFNSKKIDLYCKSINDILNNQDLCLEKIKSAIKIAESSGINIHDKNQLKQKEKTEILLRAL